MRYPFVEGTENQLIRPSWNRRDGCNKFVPRSHDSTPVEDKVCHRRRCESYAPIVVGKVLVFVRIRPVTEYIGVTWRRDACKKGDTKYRRPRFVPLAMLPDTHWPTFWIERTKTEYTFREQKRMQKWTSIDVRHGI